jgi:hypothetical protein
MAKSYRVTGALATPYREDGTRAYLYEGSEWPDGLRDGETDRFLDLGLIGEEGEAKDDSAPAKKAAAKKSSK